MITKKIDIEIPSEILKDWQDILDILSNMLNIPAALIMRIQDPYIEVFVSSDNQKNPYRLGQKEILLESGLYCEKVIKSKEKLLIPNALVDESWKNNPDIKLNMISYLGFPILFPNQNVFGTICILDNKPNEYSEIAEKLMTKLKSVIESHLSIIFINQILGDKNKKLNDYLMELQTFRGIIPICANCKSLRDKDGNWISVENYLIKHPEAEFSHDICEKCQKQLYPDFCDK